jgi:hypothetical protein
VNEPVQPAAPEYASAGDGEVIDALPVLAGDARVTPAQPISGAHPTQRPAGGAVIPAVQAAAVAAGGFVAGAAVAGLVHRRQRRSSTLAKGRRAGGRIKTRPPHRSQPHRPRRAGRGGRAVELVQIVGSRSLLVDVHLLGSAGDR